MATLNISLPDSLKEYAQKQAENSDYSNPSDFVRTLIRQHKEAQAEQERLKAVRAKFEAELLKGLSGEPIPVTPEYWKEKRARLHAALEAQK